MTDAESEVKRFIQAIEKTKRDVEQTRQSARKKLGEEEARIFDAHLMLLEDIIVIEETTKHILKEKKNADFIILEMMNRIVDSMREQEGGYLNQRVADIQDVSQRIIRNLRKEKRFWFEEIQAPTIVVAPDLTPSEAIHLSPEKVLGFATDLGGRTSHYAILARSLGVPLVVGLGKIWGQVETGDTLIVNGNSGKVILRPTREQLEEYRLKRKRYLQFEESLLNLKDLPARTLDGHQVILSANIELAAEVDIMKKHGAQGIGLFRTEYLYLRENRFPSEEEQYQEYRGVAEAIYPDPVIFRTFDLGGDKMSADLDHHKEMNPFLGYRAIRACLDQPDLFKPQLRAILRASSRRNVKVMFPFISGLEELRAAKGVLEGVKSELLEEGVSIDRELEVGIMVETPSAVVMADLLATEVDFFSIGTNDLTQFTLAVDRGNERVSHLYNALHPAVLSMIKGTVDAGKKAGIWVGMCGEMAGDPLAVLILLGLGLQEFSVSPMVLPEVKKIIRSITHKESRQIAEESLKMHTTDELQGYIEGVMKRKFADLPIWFK